MSSDPNDILSTLWRQTFTENLPGSYRDDLFTLVKGKTEGGTSLERLPDWVCSSVGGDAAVIAPISMAWRYIYLAAKLFDDVQDGDSRLPAAAAINQGLGVLWVAHSFLETDDTGWPPDVRLEVLRRLHRHLLRANGGQDADIRLAPFLPLEYTPDDWDRIASAKSGDLFYWTAWATAWVLTQQAEASEACGTFGRHLGILLQVLDDFEGIWGKGGSDIGRVALNLALSYAYTVADADIRIRLTNLLAEGRTGAVDNVAEVRSLLDGMGTREFMWTVAQMHARMAYDAIANVPGVDPAPLAAILGQVFPPFQDAVYTIADK